MKRRLAEIAAGIVMPLLCHCSPALASHHPAEAVPAFVDEAAIPTYPIETVAPLRKGWRHSHDSSVHALRRPRSRRPLKARHVDKKPPRRAEELAHSAKAAVPVPPEPVEDALTATAGALLGLVDGLEARIIASRPYRMDGVVEVAGRRFDYVSGGAGWSIPYGDWPIDNSAGRWGARHGALGLNDDSMPDRYLGRDRGGIEIHADYSGRTEGCFGVKQWQAFKRAVLAMVRDFGAAYLHVRPEGATVSPLKKADPFVMLARAKDAPTRHRYAESRHRRWRHRHVASR